jgi:SAM-dependent methyltransferase
MNHTTYSPKQVHQQRAGAANLPVAERLGRLLDGLGIARAHLAGSAVQMAALALARPDAVASLALVCPPPPAVPLLRQIALPPSDVLVLAGDRGPLSGPAARVASALPGSSLTLLPDYTVALWSDIVFDRTDEVAAALLHLLDGAQARHEVESVRLLQSDGEIAGITYQTLGSGPPLLLFPLHMAASQWDPLLSRLSERYSVIVLGGAHLGIVAGLESRAGGGYQEVFGAVLGAAAPSRGETILEVGCGSGAITRWIAHRTCGENPVVGVDLSRYLLREAAQLARHDGVADRIDFRFGDALALPFDDGSVDVVLSCTVMEEVDADRMLAELVRVTRPGGRIGVVVRAEDIEHWVSLDLPADLRRKAMAAVGQAAGTAAGGCADVSLYRRFHESGLSDLMLGPRLAVEQTFGGPDLRRQTFEGRVLAALSPEEARVWQVAAARATADGVYLWAYPYHCAVGTRR